jgi:ferrochelatase
LKYIVAFSFSDFHIYYILASCDDLIESMFSWQPLVPLGNVEELLAAYDSQHRELPSPVIVWEWGLTKSAETWNGRVAMLAVLLLLFFEVTTPDSVFHQLGILSPAHR